MVAIETTIFGEVNTKNGNVQQKAQASAQAALKVGECDSALININWKDDLQKQFYLLLFSLAVTPDRT